MNFDDPQFETADDGVYVQFSVFCVFVPNGLITGYCQKSEGNWPRLRAAQNIAQAFSEKEGWIEEWEFVQSCADDSIVEQVRFN